MKKNIGNTDQVIRIILGLVIGIIGIINHSWWGLLGFVPLATSLFSFCPIYQLFGIRTNKKS
ncbi:MAG: DUF2892 domain-containing protein [Bacteroidales bacterium]|nr:DUF2892 domain-containing protein [Bacteroidales bacterium]